MGVAFVKHLVRSVLIVRKVNTVIKEFAKVCRVPDNYTYIHTYHSRFIPKGVAEVSQIFLQDTHVLPKFVSYEEHCRRDRW
jgi:hypothetical protein